MKEELITIYAIIPSDVYSTKKLTCEEKLIAERITALCKKEGYAWITNKAIADMYGIREDTVSRHIRHLKEYGYIKCLYCKNDKGKSQRTIYLANNIWDIKPTSNSINKHNEIDQTVGHNNKDKYKKNNKENKPIISFDTDGVMLWGGKRCEQELATSEEEREFRKSLGWDIYE